MPPTVCRTAGLLEYGTLLKILCIMLRFLGVCGMGSMFLAISPPLRTNVMDKFAFGVRTMDMNAPYPYIGGGCWW